MFSKVYHVLILCSPLVIMYRNNVDLQFLHHTVHKSVMRIHLVYILFPFTLFVVNKHLYLFLFQLKSLLKPGVKLLLTLVSSLIHLVALERVMERKRTS